MNYELVHRPQDKVFKSFLIRPYSYDGQTGKQASRVLLQPRIGGLWTVD